MTARLSIASAFAASVAVLMLLNHVPHEVYLGLPVLWLLAFAGSHL